MAGRASLPHLCSPSVNQSRLAGTRKTLLQLSPPNPWGFPTEISDLRFVNLPHLNQSPSRRQTRSLQLPSLSLRPSASPPCPTSRSQTPPMTSLPSTPRAQTFLVTGLPTTPQPQHRMRSSISRTRMWKCCAETLCSVFTLASCPSTPLLFVGCSPRPNWPWQTHQMVAPAFCPRTPPQILPRFSRQYIFPGKLFSWLAEGWLH